MHRPTGKHEQGFETTVQCATHMAMASVYEAVFMNTESFEVDNIGADLAYLLGAMLHGFECEWTIDRPLVQLLNVHIPRLHEVWRFIKFVQRGE